MTSFTRRVALKLMGLGTAYLGWPVHQSPSAQADDKSISPGLKQVDNWANTHDCVWLGENFFHVEDPAQGEPECYRININHYMTPEKHNSCHYWYSATFDFAKPDPDLEAMANEAFSTAFQEDVVAIDHMQILLDDDTTDYKEININGDKAGVLLRRKMLEWALAENPELATP